MIKVGGVEVKSTWVTRRAPLESVEWAPLRDPGLGDLLLCELVSIGLHGRAETTSGSREKLYAGDHIVCAVGNRYATSLLEAVAEVGQGDIDLISASGLCGRVVQGTRKASNPTRLRPLAQAHVGGAPVNLRSCALAPAAAAADSKTRWVVVVGSAMDSGKTTACTSIIHGLSAAGRRVGAGKLTGTASARDYGAFRDAGAAPFVDFLDFGWPSTVGCTERELLDLFDSVTSHIRAAGAEWGVIEIADGLLQTDTAFLLGAIGERLGNDATCVLTVRESLAAVAGVEMLNRLGLPITAVSGLITNSPMSCNEVDIACGVACVPTAELGRRIARGELIVDRSRALGSEPIVSPTAP